MNEKNKSVSIDVIMVKPKTLSNFNQAAFIYAHGGGACIGSAQFLIDECHRYAVDWNCVCFSVDYRKGPEVQCPRNQLDFMESIDYIYENSDKLGINKNKICVGGLSGGGWICMGAMVQYYKQKKRNPVKCQFLITPMVAEVLPNVPE